MTLKQKALAHYDRMIAWAEKQPTKSYVDPYEMESSIGEHYDGEYCAYCRKHILCSTCDLYAKSKKYGEHCCGGRWISMSISKTWSTWVKRARRVREYIEKHG